MATIAPTTYRARLAAAPLGLAEGESIVAVQWDGTEQGANDIVDWVADRGGVASQSVDAILIVDAGDLCFTRHSQWVAHLPDGTFTVFGDPVISASFDLTETEHPVFA